MSHSVDCPPVNTDSESAKTKTSKDVADQVRLAGTKKRSGLAVVLVVVR